MSRAFAAKFPGHCAGCGFDIKKGAWVRFAGRNKLYHDNCVPSGNRRADREYYAGIADGNRYLENKRWFGEEMASRMEFERELREGWDY